jgi:polygalacturonase
MQFIMNVILTLWNGNVQSLWFLGTTNTVVRDITSINSKQFHISIDSCNNVLAEGLTIRAPGDSPNTDGIHISSANVKLRNINIGTGGSYFPSTF